MKKRKRNKTYIEKYGIEMVKKHPRNNYSGRYFSTSKDYANTGITLFKEHLFKLDINMSDFPIEKADQNGWNLPKAPTPEEFEKTYNKLLINKTYGTKSNTTKRKKSKR